MHKSKFYWSIKKATSSHDLNLLVKFNGRLFKTGSIKIDVWETDAYDDSLSFIFGEPIIVKYVIDEDILYFDKKLKIISYNFTEVDGKWDILYSCLNEQNKTIKILQSLL